MVTIKRVVPTWKWLVGGVAGVVASLVVVLIVVQAQQSAPSLTIADRLEIQELLHRYMFVLDNCAAHNNGYDYADLYTPDGRFGNGPAGREALAKAAGRTSDGNCSAIRLRGPMNQVHINVGLILKPTPEGAKGISYLMMIDGPAHEVYWNGWYQDVFAKTPRGWRFKSRRHFGGAPVGVPAELAAARMLWEAQPTPAGSRTLVGKATVPGTPEPIASDPLTWLDQP
jgi:hypothetical protein